MAHPVRRHRRLAAWLAIFAILLNALAPSVSHAIGAQRGDPLLGAVCTSDRSGLALAVLAAASADDEHDGSARAMSSACPFCLTHAGTPAILPSPPALLRAPRLGHAPPRLFLAAPRPLFAWAAVHARGPPILS